MWKCTYLYRQHRLQLLLFLILVIKWVIQVIIITTHGDQATWFTHYGFWCVCRRYSSNFAQEYRPSKLRRTVGFSSAHTSTEMLGLYLEIITRPLQFSSFQIYYITPWGVSWQHRYNINKLMLCQACIIAAMEQILNLLQTTQTRTTEFWVSQWDILLILLWIRPHHKHVWRREPKPRNIIQKLTTFGKKFRRTSKHR